MNLRNFGYWIVFLYLLIWTSCSKQQANCVCSNQLEFKLGDLGPAVRGSYNDIIKLGESNLIKFSILNSSLCPFVNIEVVIKNGSKIFHKENYLDPISQAEILVPDHSELIIESKLVDANRILNN
jgi:hypothetical protein